MPLDVKGLGGGKSEKATVIAILLALSILESTLLTITRHLHFVTQIRVTATSANAVLGEFRVALSWLPSRTIVLCLIVFARERLLAALRYAVLSSFAQPHFILTR